MSDVFAVIAPDGSLSWHPASQAQRVEELCAGAYATSSITSGAVMGPVRYMASDLFLLFPEKFEPNETARAVLADLTGGKADQEFRGHIALSEYDQGGHGFPTVMSAGWRERIEAAHRKARSGQN
jgi:hypothetical protein